MLNALKPSGIKGLRGIARGFPLKPRLAQIWSLAAKSIFQVPVTQVSYVSIYMI